MTQLEIRDEINKMLSELKIKHSWEGRIFLELLLEKAWESPRRCTMTELYRHVVDIYPREITLDCVERNVRYLFNNLERNTPLADKLFGDINSNQTISNKDGFYTLLYELNYRLRDIS